MSISGLLFPERKFTMFYVFLAEGFEETEALAPVDVMRRAKLDVKTVGVTGECVTSSHGVPVKADITIDNIDLDDVQGVVLPGGIPAYQSKVPEQGRVRVRNPRTFRKPRGLVP